MKRAIEIEQSGDHEGLLYDPTIAKTEGLYEELTLKTTDGDGTEYPVTVTDELFEALSNALDLGVNVEPGHKQGFPLMLEYVYDYGREEIPA